MPELTIDYIQGLIERAEKLEKTVREQTMSNEGIDPILASNASGLIGYVFALKSLRDT